VSVASGHFLAPGEPLEREHVELGEFDVLVVGSGVAGLSLALSLAGRRRVGVISKEADGGGSTLLAQGGMAAAIGPGDTAAAHAADTVAASAGLGDPAAAQVVTGEAAQAVAMLAGFGVRFDQGAPAREGGHSAARVVHARGDATGAEISRALMASARSEGVVLLTGMFLVELLGPPGGAVTGALIWDGNALRQIRTRTVVLATGGYGQLWARTTSPRACSGDGLAVALRAGAQLADLEFVQFHPTGMDLGSDPRPLASEALRGAGARLRGADGEYLNQVASSDLAPRDVVSRAMARRMAELGADHCYLDATPLGEALLESHFPTFLSACRAAGRDPAREWVPVSPTAHYTMGGVLADCDGRTTLEGLMAVGEVASSGLHGANRLASNSLLEGAVVGRRAALAILASKGPVAPLESVPLDEELSPVEHLGTAPLVAPGGAAGRKTEPWDGLGARHGGVVVDRTGLRAAMEAYAGVCRDAEGLEWLSSHLSSLVAKGGLGAPGGSSGQGGAPTGPQAWELANMVLLGSAVATLAARRRESRGAHWRSDYPSPHPDWRARQVVQLQAEGELGVGNLDVPADVQARSEAPQGSRQSPSAPGPPVWRMAGATEAVP
jgi:L-aspartate oxidase